MVKVVKSGSQALTIAQIESPDFILLDIMMSVMDGYEVCRWLKSNPATQSIPVVFLTVSLEEDQKGL